MELEQPIVAHSDTLSGEAMNWLFFGILAIPTTVVALAVFLLDWRAIEELPKTQGFSCVLAVLLVTILLVLAYVWLFPAVARRLFRGVYRVILYENGLSISNGQGNNVCFLYTEFDEISIKKFDSEICLRFFREGREWDFILRKNNKKFRRVIQLANKLN